MAGRIVVGTSSWADPGFVAEWYPKGMAARDRLAWYAERFEMVELNSSFYAIPDPATVERWAQVTPAGFTFHVKLHRLLSRHAAPADSLPPELRAQAEVDRRGRVRLTPEIEAATLDATLAAVEPLQRAGKLGAFLLQLTPGFSPKQHSLEELDPVIDRLAPHPVAVELRNRNWTREDVLPEALAHLSEHDAAWVGVDAPRAEHFTIMPPVDAVTDDRLAYLRAHGRNADGYLSGRSVAERFGWEYSDEELEEIAGRARELAGTASIVNIAFNNNRGADAPTSARRMRELLGQDAGPPPGATAGQMTLG
ncbi:MAG: hypothetical protein QOE65_340 [Solirubrobacteraceae bacterium]|jgi:uncharacterized protein YecE (DUF72 family)|nr:hypothetical protein [Solirubrobacteraceae bacterium]